MSLLPRLSFFRASENARFSYLEISRLFNPVSNAARILRSTACQAHRQDFMGYGRRPSHERQWWQDQEKQAESVQAVEKFGKSLSFPKATHEIRDLSNLEGVENIKVILHGYLHTRTDFSHKLCFVTLFDRNLSFSVQVISNIRSSSDSACAVHEKLKAIRLNSPVVLTGTLKSREPPKKAASDLSKKNAHVEVEVTEVECLNEWPTDIIMKPETLFPSEQRHLQLRQSEALREALNFRAKVAALCRDELSRKYGFTEIETPLLFKSTPEGAQEFIVPTRRKGLAYALPQSPQQFKQILMASGISRYYQIAKCFRDEDSRADRQPEFTQLDLEMSFASGSDVMECVETLIARLWSELLGIELPSPIPRMTYENAMSTYGSDKPDVRLGVPISRIEKEIPAELIRNMTSLTDPAVEAIVFPFGKIFDSDPTRTREFTTSFFDSPHVAWFQKNPSGGPGIFIYDPSQPLEGLHAFGFDAASNIKSKLSLQPGDLLILQARPDTQFTTGSTPLGNLRLAIYSAAVKKGHVSAPTGFAPLWITHFPLFTPIPPSSPSSPSHHSPAPPSSPSNPPSPQENPTLTSTHHPFTSPATAADVAHLLTSPHLALADHYDLVINGIELGGGSRRIHHAALQQMILRDVLRLPPTRLRDFAHLVEVLRAGCPPHAGIALGLDRLVTVMLNRTSVRDVIAFPKSGRGEDPLVGAPALLEEGVLKTYHLKIREREIRKREIREREFARAGPARALDDPAAGAPSWWSAFER